MMKRRPVAVPLFTVDPFFSVWSCADKLYNGYTKHWTEKPWPIFAGVYIDGTVHAVAGTDDEYRTFHKRIHQTDLQVTPLSTVYTFENDVAKVKLTFEGYKYVAVYQRGERVIYKLNSGVFNYQFPEGEGALLVPFN